MRLSAVCACVRCVCLGEGGGAQLCEESDLPQSFEPLIVGQVDTPMGE